MQTSPEEIRAALDAVKDIPVLVVGDIILDRYVWGSVDRISPEAPVPVVNVRSIEDRIGGAGNVVQNLLGMGAKVSLCGFVGDDEEGRIILSKLDKLGVKRDGVMIDTSKPTSLKTRVIAQRQQIVRIDREDKSQQGPERQEGFAAVVDAHVDAAKAVIVSDYGKGAVSGPLMQRFSQARKASRVGLKKRPLVVDPYPTNADLYSGVSIAKPNRREAEASTGIKINDRASAVAAAEALLKKWSAEMIIVTLGADGLVIVSPGSPGIFLETVAKEVFDVSGAGDTVTALFALAVAAGASPAVAGDLANIGAGIVVSEVGTVPVNRARMLDEIENLARLR